MLISNTKKKMDIFRYSLFIQLFFPFPSPLSCLFNEYSACGWMLAGWLSFILFSCALPSSCVTPFSIPSSASYILILIQTIICIKQMEHDLIGKC